MESSEKFEDPNFFPPKRLKCIRELYLLVKKASPGLKTKGLMPYFDDAFLFKGGCNFRYHISNNR